MGSQLIVILSEPIGTDRSGKVGVLAKTLEGLIRFARGWPGEVVVSARSVALGDDPLASVMHSADLPFSLDLREDPLVSPALVGARVVLAAHAPSHAPLLSSDPRRIVWIAEFPVRERIRSAVAGAGVVRSARMTLGWIRRGRTLRMMVAAAGGLQANGYPAYAAYAADSVAPMLFFDTRITRAIVEAESSTRPRLSELSGRCQPLHVAFSGRHEEVKGPLHAVRAVLRARELGVKVTMDIFGQGAQTEQMRAAAAPAGESIAFHGSVPFADQWVPTVRDGVDLMVLPHVQGDPAGTYLEAAALGVPVLGFANAALTALVREHGIGWTVPMRDDRRLAEKLVELAQDPGEVALAGHRGIEFMRRHAFEDEFDRRVAHLREVAQL